MINKKQVIIDSKAKLLAIIYSNTTDELAYALGDDRTVLKVDLKTGKVGHVASFSMEDLNFEKPNFLELSSDDRFLVVANTYGQFGYVYDLGKEELVLKLDRKDYRIENSHFLVNFFRYKDMEYLVHATDWNHIDVFDLAKKENITQRDTNVYKGEAYQDYFYGKGFLSPSQQFLLSSGWVWGPASVLRFIDLEDWLSKTINRPEHNHPADFGIMSYYWDRALTWVDADTVAYLFDPREEGMDDEELEEAGLEKGTGYVLLYSVEKADIIKKLVFNTYGKDEYFEGTADCRVYYNGNLIISSKEFGLYVMELETGKLLFTDKNSFLDAYSETFKQFYHLAKDNTVELIDIQ